MKRTFTLVELLVSIAIIAILAGILLPAANGAIKKAQATKAKAEITTLVNAIKQYESTYGVLPIKDSTKGKVDSGDYDNFIKMLQGNPSNSAPYKADEFNKRKIKFLDVMNNEEGFYKDPWDNDYIIFLDVDGNDVIGDSETDGLPGGIATTGSKIYGSIVIYSLGPDGKDWDSSKKDQGKDNVYSLPVVWDKNDKQFVITH